jgi:phosphoribosylformylglycinamidine synthase subunit PurSL
MAQRIYVGTKPFFRDALGERVRTKIISDLNIGTITAIRTATVYAINGHLPADESVELAEGPLSDPIVQDYTIDSSFCEAFDWLVEVGYRPGVTDNVGRTAREAAVVLLRRDPAPDFSVHTGTQYFISGKLSRKRVEQIGRAMLANELIQSMSVYTHDEWMAVHRHEFAPPIVKSGTVAVQPYSEVNLSGDAEALLRISRERVLALSAEEMRVIRDHYATTAVKAARAAAGLPANPTNVELEILAQTWSEHCKHKIFAAAITYRENDRTPVKVDGLFKQFIRKATEDVRRARGAKDICLSVFKDDAGIVRFDEHWGVSFKVETHNSPSALDPYGGALTGIVGVNRDSFAAGMGGRLIANTDVFCFASPFHDEPLPPRLLHPKRVLEGVREGVEHGGNKSGIPTVNGAIVFDERFLGKPLVYCGTLAVVPLEVAGRKGYEKRVEVGDHLIMVGGRIGKDGIHGATFSSEELHEGSPVTAVQIGDPITQKRATDFLLHARDLGLYNGMTDNGAGGLSSSVGELARQTGGATLHLERAPLKYHGLEPWEIVVSEAQERMSVVVPPAKVPAFLELAAEWNAEATDLGEFNDSGCFTLVYNGAVVGRLDMDFLHEGLPRMKLNAWWKAPVVAEKPAATGGDLAADLLGLLKRLNICSKEYVVRQYDHEVQGGSVVKPLCGSRNDGPSDAAVFRPLLDSSSGLVVSNGIAPRYSDLDAYSMVSCGFDEAVRNAVASGADPDHMAALDNFCWCDPIASPENADGEYKLGQLVRANMALYDMCVAYGIPLISGKDSMKNDYRIGETRISIPPTVLVSLVARIDDVARAVTMDFKTAGNAIFLLGTTYRELGASEYAALKGASYRAVPQVHDAREARSGYCALHAAIGKGHVRAAHDLSDGGLAVALAEMCFAGELGASVDLAKVKQMGCTLDEELLFSESPCRVLLEVPAEHTAALETLCGSLPLARIGTVERSDVITVRGLGGREALRASRIDCKAAWKSTLNF